MRRGRTTGRLGGQAGLLCGLVVLAVVSGGASPVTAGSAGHGPTSTTQPTEISHCQEIDRPGTYVLTRDIINSTQNYCITISASHVVFDGAGHRIDGIDKIREEGYDQGHATKGIRVGYAYGPVEDVTIKNVIVTDWGQGMGFSYASHGKMVNNTANSNIVYGMYLGNYANDNVLSNNTASDNRDHGLYLSQRSDGNVVKDNEARRNGFAGIGIGRSDDNTVVDNVVTNNRIGLSIRNGSSNRLLRNEVHDNQDEGILVRKDSTNNTIAANTVSGNTVGIYLYNRTTANVVADNVARENDRYGLYLDEWSDGNKIIGNTLNNNGWNGVRVTGTTGTVFRNNTAVGNGDWALFAGSESNVTVANLTIGSNISLSFRAFDVAVTSRSAPPPAPAGTTLAGAVNVVDTTTTTDAWINLTVRYPDASIATIQEPTLRLWIHQHEWARIAGANRVDPSNNTVSANLTLEGAGTLGIIGDRLTTATSTPTPTERPVTATTERTSTVRSASPSGSPPGDGPPKTPGFGFGTAVGGIAGAAVLIRRVLNGAV